MEFPSSLQNNVRLIPDSVEVEKDAENRIGIAIGGGAPHCPCLYIVEVFQGGPIALNGRLQVGDELLSVNGIGVKGQAKTKVASLIQQAPSPIRLSINRIQLLQEGKRVPSLDIFLKKLKHRFVEAVDPEVADALGLSRAILSNDLMSRLAERLERNTSFYRELGKCAEAMRSLYGEWGDTQHRLGLTLADIGNKEAKEEDRCMIEAMADCHKKCAKQQEALSGKLGQFVEELHVYAHKAVPDTQQSMNRYLDAKHTYLSLCLKVKELEDEEMEVLSAGGQLQRVASGNLEYRAMLRYRERSRQQFIEQRKHAIVKTELLEEKHVMELASQLKRVIEALAANHINCRDLTRAAVEKVPANQIGTPIAEPEKIEVVVEEGGEDNSISLLG